MMGESENSAHFVNGVRQVPAMSLRDHFAGQAMAALITRSRHLAAESKTFAGAAYELADAMLAVRVKGGNQ